MENVRYAIVDGAVVDDLLDFLSANNPPHSCLYSEPLQPELIKLAPYLIEVTPEVEEWLISSMNPWGIYLTTTVTMRVLRQHLRKYLQVLLPDEAKPVIFRFYDPRNIWDFLSVLSDWEKHVFLQPVTKIETIHGSYKELSLDKLHEFYPASSRTKSHSKVMIIKKDQYSKLEKIFEQRYIEDLTDLIKCATPSEASKNIFSTEWPEILFNYLRNLGIKDRRSIDGIAKLLAREDIHSIRNIPDRYKVILEGTTTPGHYRTDLLLLNVYGEIPTWKRS